MKLTAIMAALFVALVVAGHFAWAYLAPATPSPIAAIVDAYGILVLKVLGYAAGYYAFYWVYKRVFIMLFSGVTLGENSRRPPEKVTYEDHEYGGSYEFSHRDSRARNAAGWAFFCGLVVLLIVLVGNPTWLFFTGIICAWLMIAAPIRVKMAPIGPPKPDKVRK